MNCDLCTYRVRLPGYEDKVGMPISLTPHGDGARAREAARPAGDARAAGADRARPARPGLRPAPAVEVPAGRRRRSTCAGCASPIPTAARRSPASTCRCAAGERVAVLGPNGAGKTTLVLQLNGHAEGGEGTIARRAAWSSARARAPRCAAAWGSSSRTPTTSSSCRPSRADVAFGPANLGLRGDALRERVDEALDARRAAGRAPTARRTSCRPASAAARRSPACWRWSPTC